MSFKYVSNPNFDSTKPRIAGILQEHGLLSSQSYVDEIYRIGRAEGINFMDETAIVRLAKYGCTKCREENKERERNGAKAKECIHKVPEDQSLWANVFQGFDERDTPGNRSMLLSESPRPINAANLSKTFHAIMRSGDPGGKLGVTQEEDARQQEQAERESMIRELTKAGSFVVIRPGGEKVRYDTDGRPIEHSTNGMTPVGGRGRQSDPGFAGMETTDLRNFYNTVTEQRRLRALSPAELKTEINPARRQIFEAASASSRPTPTGGIELINPNTGQVINSKRDLIRYVNSSRYATERLLKTGPNGSTDKNKAREFERILNS